MVEVRECKMCQLDITQYPVYYVTCDYCFGDYADANLRACTDCNRKKILNTEPAWKTTCGGCYKLKAALPNRTCEVCKQDTIRATAKDRTKVCKDCYLIKRNKK